MIAPEPYLSAYLEVSKSAVTYTRSIALENGKSLRSRLSKKRSENIADLQDSIHVVLEMLNKWERCDESALRADYLESYDRKWVKNEDDFSLLRIFNTVLRETDNRIANS